MLLLPLISTQLNFVLFCGFTRNFINKFSTVTCGKLWKFFPLTLNSSWWLPWASKGMNLGILESFQRETMNALGIERVMVTFSYRNMIYINYLEHQMQDDFFWLRSNTLISSFACSVFDIGGLPMCCRCSIGLNSTFCSDPSWGGGGGGGRNNILNRVFFVQKILIDRYIHRRELWVISLKSPSSLEHGIKKFFLNSVFMSELPWFKLFQKLGRFVLFLFKFSGIFA